jgi:VanZ family protein
MLFFNKKIIPHLSKGHFTPAIIYSIIVLVLLCLPGSDLPKVGGWWDKIYFDKWIHIGLFGGVTYLFVAPIFLWQSTSLNKMQWAIKIALSSSIWGLAMEFVQKYYIPGRSFDLDDWIADTVGAILALLFCIVYFKPKKAAPFNS